MNLEDNILATGVSDSPLATCHLPLATEKKAAPFFSIIIPVYNVAPYLRECLDSVLVQTFTDWECLCVDDGSTDESGAILDEYAQKDPRFRVFHKPNGGVSSARNLGLDKVRGKWILFVDADDYITENCLNLFSVGCLKNRYTYISCCVYTLQNNILKRVLRPQEPLLWARDDFLADIDVIFSSTIWGIAFNVEYLNKQKIRFNRAFKVHEDALFMLEVLLNAEVLHHQPFVGYCYRLPDYDNAENRKSLVTTTRRAYYYSRVLVARYLIGKAYFNVIEKGIVSYFLKRCMWAFWSDYDRALKSSYQIVQENNFFDKAVCKMIECKTFYEKIVLVMCKIASLRLFPYSLWVSLKKFICLTFFCTRCLHYVMKKVILGKNMNFTVLKTTLIGRCVRNLLPASRREVIKSLWFRIVNKRPKYCKKVQTRGITLKSRDVPIVISLTSYPARINTLAATISTLLSQTIKPDQVILWLAESQFPQREQELPRVLLRLIKFGLTIKWCDDIRSYKKLIPTLNEYPNTIIVTADDDVYYHPDWLKTLYDSYLEKPYAVHAHCVRNVYLSPSKDVFAPYSSWKHDNTMGRARFSALQIGVGGVLYPPHCFHSDILDETLFTRLAPNADDLWFWAMAILAETPIIRVKNAMMPAVNYRANTTQSLCKQNLEGGANDLQLKNLAIHYPELIQMVRQELLT